MNLEQTSRYPLPRDFNLYSILWPKSGNSQSPIVVLISIRRMLKIVEL